MSEIPANERIKVMYPHEFVSFLNEPGWEHSSEGDWSRIEDEEKDGDRWLVDLTRTSKKGGAKIFSHAPS